MADIAPQFNLRQLLSGKGKEDVIITAGVLTIVMMMLIPLPAIMLDLFMTLNLVFSVLIIMIVMYNKDPLEFSIFPSLLLVTTLFGLALNVSSTRLILTKGEQFDGKIVRAFSTFVVGSSGTEGLVVGFIIFVIIIAVQLIVITKGATRISEVAARFTLDALATKQMAIEAEYSSGAITEQEMRDKKKHLDRTSDFYGAMDGATKFVSGNVKVSIFIALINIVGGLIVGVSLRNEGFVGALNTYTLLTIGDGLVSQLPALLVSVGTGFIVARSVSEGSFGSDVVEQFSRQGKIYWISATFLAVMGALPGFPSYILFPLAGIMGFMAFRMRQKESANKRLKEEKAESDAKPQKPEEISPIVPLDPISLELGYGLIPLVDKESGAELLDRLTHIRRETALELGLVIPRVRIIDSMKLQPSEYCIKIKGIEIGRGSIRMGRYMAINPGGEKVDITGEQTTDPAFGLPALWVDENVRDQAERAGYTIVDAPSIIATHMVEIIKKNSADILGRQEVQSMLDALREEYATVVEEVMKTLSVGEIQKVLQSLLREQVSIRNLVSILETLGDYAGLTKETGYLTERVRQALKRQICNQYMDENRTLSVLTVEPAMEQRIIDTRIDTADGAVAALEPEESRNWVGGLSESVGQVQQRGFLPIVLCSEAARPLIKKSCEREVPGLIVLSLAEIDKSARLESLGEIQALGSMEG